MTAPNPTARLTRWTTRAARWPAGPVWAAGPAARITAHQATATAAVCQAEFFMPASAPLAKVGAVRAAGGVVRLVSGAYDEANAAARAHSEATGMALIHAFDDPSVVAGQGTIGLEIAEQVPDAGTVVIPVGGGGLSSGISLALRAVKPDLRIVGVQAGLDGWTIADGIAVKSVGEETGRILDGTLDDMVSVSDEEICKAIVLLLERAKLVVEGAGAVGVAALLADKVGGDGPVVPLLSGGNIDPTVLISVMRHGLTLAGRYLVVRTRLEDRPGELIKLLKLVAQERANVISVEHHREGMDVPVTESEIELTLTMRDEHHCSVLLETLRSLGYQVERLR